MGRRRRRSLFGERAKRSDSLPAPDADGDGGEEADDGTASDADATDEPGTTEPAGTAAHESLGDDEVDVDAIDESTDETQIDRAQPSPPEPDAEPEPETEPEPEAVPEPEARPVPPADARPLDDDGPTERMDEASASRPQGSQPSSLEDGALSANKPPPSFADDPQADETPTERFDPEQNPDMETRRPDGQGFGSLGNFDDMPPPTDEVPSAVLQDVSQPYTAPMNVPEPPPLPGILDRFTPPGAQQRVSANPKQEQRPSYIADTPPPPPLLQNRAEGPVGARKVREPIGKQDEGGGLGGPVVIGMVAFVGLGAVLALIALVAMGSFSGGDPEPDPKPETLTGPAGISVPVRDGLNQEDPDPLAPDPEPGTDGTDGTEDPEPDGGTDDGTEDPEPVAAPAPVEPQPVRPAPPRPAPEPDPEPVAEMGTLKIKSNRNVLIYVDGKAVGYTPQSYKAEPGSRTVSAMLPGRPESKETKTVELKAGATLPVNFTF